MLGLARASSFHVVIWDEAELLWLCECSRDQFERAGLFSALALGHGAAGSCLLSAWNDLLSYHLSNHRTKLEQINATRHFYESPLEVGLSAVKGPPIPNSLAKIQTTTILSLRKHVPTHDEHNKFLDNMNTSPKPQSLPIHKVDNQRRIRSKPPGSKTRYIPLRLDAFLRVVLCDGGASSRST